MNSNLNPIIKQIYELCSFKFSGFEMEPESKEYDACRFYLNDARIICRSAKITPKKVGQFVTFWKRNKEGIIAPLDVNDVFDFYVVNVTRDNDVGQFVFPKSELLKRGIISSDKKEGKRALRVYPDWDQPSNRTALRTQKWQADYFYQVNNETDVEKVKLLYDVTHSR